MRHDIQSLARWYDARSRTGDIVKTLLTTKPVRDKPRVIFPKFEESLFWLFEGWRGSGKSLTMAHFLAKAMVSGYRVLSNMTVKFDFPFGKSRGKKHHYCSEPLTEESVYLVQGGANDCVIGIDELQTWGGDCQNWGSWKAKLLNAVMVQMRKRHLTFLATLQSWDWLNNRLQQQCDVLVESKDLALTERGRERHLLKGYYFVQRWFDSSGNWRGKPLLQTGWHQNVIFHGRPYWSIYKTEEAQDVLEGFRPVSLDLSPRRITDRTSQQRDDETTGQMVSAINRLIGQGQTLVASDDLWDLAQIPDSERSRLGAFLKQLGVVRKQRANGYFYDLSGVEK